MTDHPLRLRMSWQIHRPLDRLSGGRATRPIPVAILEPRTAG